MLKDLSWHELGHRATRCSADSHMHFISSLVDQQKLSADRQDLLILLNCILDHDTLSIGGFALRPVAENLMNLIFLTFEVDGDRDTLLFAKLNFDPEFLAQDLILIHNLGVFLVDIEMLLVLRLHLVFPRRGEQQVGLAFGTVLSYLRIHELAGLTLDALVKPLPALTLISIQGTLQCAELTGFHSMFKRENLER